jgi:ABC-type transport system involved in cytochrome c biogenesis ATPase subunit
MLRILNDCITGVSNVINVSVRSNEQLTIYGMNGAGKTMLLNRIAGNKHSSDAINMRKLIHYAYQVGLERHLLATTLSSGQRKKIAFIRVMSSGRRIWILDEPDNFMDNVTIQYTGGKILEHVNSGGIIIVTRNK